MSGEELADLPNAGWRPGGPPSLPEYFGLKGEQPGVGVSPCIGGQSRFAGKIGQGGFAVPVLFGRDLRQEYRAAVRGPQDDAVPPHDELLRGSDRFCGSQDRQLQSAFGKLFPVHRRKARVFRRRVHRVADQVLPERLKRLDVSDAAAQVAAEILQRHKAGPRLRQVRNRRNFRQLAVAEVAGDDLPDEVQQLTAFFR